MVVARHDAVEFQLCMSLDVRLAWMWSLHVLSMNYVKGARHVSKPRCGVAVPVSMAHRKKLGVCASKSWLDAWIFGKSSRNFGALRLQTNNPATTIIHAVLLRPMAFGTP